jgi:hypothetical protein
MTGQKPNNSERLYCIAPIDWWDGWIPEFNYLRGLFTDEYADNNRDRVAAYVSLRAKAERMALEAEWEGDMSFGVFVSALPPDDCGGECPVLIAWKQSNNGTTFVYSPRPLPWLQENAFHVIGSEGRLK